MSQLFRGRNLLAIFILVFLAACKGSDKGEAKESTADTTKTAPAPAPAAEMNPADMDAVKVAPNLYKVLKDTLGIRIVEVNYKAGDSSALHWHPDYVVYTLQGGTATFYAKDGSKMDNVMTAGQTMIRPGEFHSVKNTGKTDIKVILFEVNRKGGVTTPDAAMDATKVSPEIYKLKSDTLGIRVLEVTAKPGQKTGLHSHPDAALYMLEGGTVEFTSKDGKKTTAKLDKGMSMIDPAETHIAKNVGKTTFKGILVEVNRAM